MLKHPFRTGFSRRTLLQSLSFAPAAFLPAPLRLFGSVGAGLQSGRQSFDFADIRVTPHYPNKSSLDEVMQLASPGMDEFVSERYAFELEQILKHWAKELEGPSATFEGPKYFCDESIRASSWSNFSERAIRDMPGIAVVERIFGGEAQMRSERFIDDAQRYLGPLLPLKTAEFQIVAIRQKQTSPLQGASAPAVKGFRGGFVRTADEPL